MKKLTWLAVFCLGLAACGDDDPASDAGGAVDSAVANGAVADAGTDDAGVADAGDDDASGADTVTVTYTADIQPILQAKCSTCHTVAAFGGVNFASEYADTQILSTRCSGKKVYECMLERVLTGSMPMGRGCTGDPAADEGNADCLTQGELDALTAWVSADAPE
jgi:hypothetical protein